MAIKANIVIDQGSTFQTAINVTDDDEVPVNLTNYSANAQMRKHYTSLTAYTFETTISPDLGIVSLYMDANTTNSIAPGRYMYDCELTDPNGAITRLVEGIVTITPGVTR